MNRLYSLPLSLSIESNDRQMFVSASLEVWREYSELVLVFLRHELEVTKFVDPAVVGDVGSKLQEICFILYVPYIILKFTRFSFPQLIVIGFHLKLVMKFTFGYYRNNSDCWTIKKG